MNAADNDAADDRDSRSDPPLTVERLAELLGYLNAGAQTVPDAAAGQS